jgi:heat shock protein HtpX
MGATLLFLCLIVVVAALACGLVLTVLFGMIYVIVTFQLPTVQLLSWVLGGSAVCVLGIVAWEERNAPAHTVAATGATRVEQEAYPTLLATVRTLCQHANAPVPTLYVTPTETPLSLVTGFSPRAARLVVSEGLLDSLAEAELEAVLAHEIAHLKNRDVAVMTAATLPIAAAQRVVTLLTSHSQGVKYGQPSRASYADALLTLGLIAVPPLWLSGHVLWASFSRLREFAADRGAVATTGNPPALAAALRHIDDEVASRPTTDFRRVDISAFAIIESNRDDPVGLFPPVGRPLTNVFTTHPPTAARIERLREATRRMEPQNDPGD